MATASRREADPIFSIDYVDPVETVTPLDPAEPAHPADRADRADSAGSGASVETIDAAEAPDAVEPDPVSAPAEAERSADDVYVTVWRQAEPADRPMGAVRIDHATEYAVEGGMPARGVIVLSFLACLL